ncbi:SIR2 family protein [Fusobacterium polymorphum]|jgi:NAD-dependent protein deacetylases, SIR2 family|uniref:SIR2 family protein n=1 Tax=Fusobacterium nucleatum subsp. polymorphum TaxID=76857 RepID=UPI0030089F8E
MIEELKRAIKKKNIILFVGAGISATLGLPNWQELIKKIAGELDYDYDVFEQYGDSLSLAEYYENKKGNIGELRSWLDRTWSEKENEIKKSKIYEIIVKLNFSLIYTTNYDHCLEEAFRYHSKKFQKIVTIENLVDLKQDTTQIIKFHGDTTSDETIVLTESSYFKRLDFESPLDIKLRSDMLGKSILFIGYSLSDINVRILLYKLDKLWKASNVREEKRPSSYIFLPTPNPIQENILGKRGIKTIIGTNIDKNKSIEEFLSSLLIGEENE